MRKTLVSTAAAAFLLVGCAGMSETHQKTAAGAGIGAVAGGFLYTSPSPRDLSTSCLPSYVLKKQSPHLPLL